MSVEENKEVVRKYLSAFENGDVADFGQLLGSKTVSHSQKGTEQEGTPEIAKEFVENIRLACPDNSRHGHLMPPSF